MTRGWLDHDPLLETRTRVRWMLSVSATHGDLPCAAALAADVAALDCEIGDMPDDPNRPTTATDYVVQEITTMSKKTKTTHDLPDHPALARRIADRDEARAHGFDALAEELDRQIADVARCVVARDEARREADVASQRLDEASARSRAAVALNTRGTLDPNEALQLENEQTIAVAACRYLESERNTTRAALAGAEAALHGIENDKHRALASDLTQSLRDGIRSVNERDILVHHARDQGDNAETATVAWWPFFERRVLAEAQADAARKREHIWDPTPNKNLPADLEQLFAIRRAAVEARRSRMAAQARAATDEAEKAAAAARAL